MNPADAFAASSADARPLHCVQQAGLDEWRQAQLPEIGQWLDAQTFSAGTGSLVLLPGGNGIGGAVLGVADPHDPFAYAHAPYALPPGDWRLQGELDDDARRALQLGWGLGAYRFTRYKAATRAPARLVLDDADAETADLIAACTRVRDLVNTPTEHMGPQELEQVVREIALAHGAEVEVVEGDALLEANFPAIHAVGRASHRAPRLIELRWGDASHPHLALVGKGVCFDTGGLDIKPGASMLLMKKDMGGAAVALALAQTIMDAKLPVRLRVILPMVENSISGNAFRPGDVLGTRKGLSVEVGNTDAEGRLILCDALALADEEQPDLLIDTATLTGAARVALGPELPALFTSEDALAEEVLRVAAAESDPMWRLPLWPGYDDELSSKIADLNNVSTSGFSGSIIAALFLRRFVSNARAWMHLDLYAWNGKERPGRPVGAEPQTVRALYAFLKQRYAR